MDGKTGLSDVIREHYAPDVSERRNDDEYRDFIASSGESPNALESLKGDVLSSMDRLRHFGTLAAIVPTSMHSSDESHGDDTRVYQSDYRGVVVEAHYDGDGRFDCASLYGGDCDGTNVTDAVMVVFGHDGTVPVDDRLAECSLFGVMTIPSDDWNVIGTDFPGMDEAVRGILAGNKGAYIHRLVFIPFATVEDGVESAYQGDGHAPLYMSYEDSIASQKDSKFMTDGVMVRFFSGDSLEGTTKVLEIRFRDTLLSTYVRDIRWSTSDMGRMSAHVTVDPTGPFGSTDVVFDSLSGFIDADLHYGDSVSVRLVDGSLVFDSNEGGGNVALSYPRYWNGSRTVVIGSNLFCSDPDVWKKSMYSQVSLLAGDGISKNFVDRLYSQYGAMTLTDMYRTVNEDGFTLKGFGQKMVDRARKCFEEVSDADLLGFIVALALDGIGEATARKILGKVAFDAEERNVSQYTVILHLSDPLGYVGSIKDIGEKTAITFAVSYPFIVDQLNDFSILFGHYPKEFEGPVDNGGPQIVVAGSFDGMHRHDVREILIKNGYNLMTRVTSDTALLVVGVDGGRKEQAARSLGVDVFETGGDFKKGAAEIEKRFKNA